MPFSRNFIDNLEIYLTVLCLVITFSMPAVLGYHDYWRTVAVTALGISVVHGLLFWFVRRRQRQVRCDLIETIRPMLADRIKNELMVVLLAATEQRDVTDRIRVEAAITAANEITKTLDQLSLDSLRRWEQHYGVGTALSA